MTDLVETFRFDPPLLYCGDRRIPARQGRWNDKQFPTFEFRTRQVLVHCENGFTISVQWGRGCYGSNYHWPGSGFGDNTPSEFTEEPELAECGVIRPDSHEQDSLLPVNDPDEMVLAWATPAEVARLVDAVSALPTSFDGDRVVVDRDG